MKEYLKLLKENEIVRKLLLINFLCYFGAWFVHTAIYTLLIDLNAPVWALTITAALSFFSGVLLAPITGAIVDIMPTKKLLIAMLGIETFTAILLLFINSLDLIWLLFIVLFIRMSAATIYFQANMSIYPKILNTHDLKLTNELNALSWSVAYALGMAMAGLSVYAFGVKISIISSMFFYLIGIFILLKIDIINESAKECIKIIHNIKEGFMYIKQKPLLIHLILLHASVGITSYDALIALLVKFNYSLIVSTALAIGLINAIRSIGLFMGTSFMSRFVNKSNLSYFFIAQGLGLFVWALLQYNFFTGLIGSFCAGFFIAILWSFTYTLIQENTDNQYYGRVIAYNDMIFLSISTLTSLIIGFLYENGINAFVITILMGLCFFGFALYYKWIKKRFYLKL